MGLKQDHEKLLKLLSERGMDPLYDGATGELCSLDMPGGIPPRFDDEGDSGNIVQRDELIERQMNTIDALRGALAVVSRAVEALAGTPRGGGQAALPPGKVAIEEDQLRQYIDKIEGLVAEVDEVEMANSKLTEMLRQFSFAYGYGGSIDRDFEKMVSGMPHPGAPKPTQFVLPDGKKTDQIKTALFEWQHLDEQACAEAMEKSRAKPKA